MEESNVQWFARKLGEQNNRERAVDVREYEQQLTLLARGRVGQELAAEQGLTGRAAEFFIQGFEGVPARVANPRAEGLEPAFRAGRQALQLKAVPQRIRAAAEAVRRDWTLEDFKAEKYHFRPCPYEAPIRGEY